MALSASANELWNWPRRASTSDRIIKPVKFGAVNGRGGTLLQVNNSREEVNLLNDTKLLLIPPVVSLVLFVVVVVVAVHYHALDGNM